MGPRDRVGVTWGLGIESPSCFSRLVLLFFWRGSSKQQASRGGHMWARFLYLECDRPTSHETWWVGPPVLDNQPRTFGEPNSSSTPVGGHIIARNGPIGLGPTMVQHCPKKANSDPKGFKPPSWTLPTGLNPPRTTNDMTIEHFLT